MPVKREHLAAQKQAKIRKVLELIANHVWQYGYQPTLRELGLMLGWESHNYVQVLLNQHFRENYGGRKRMQSRAVIFDWHRYVTETSLSWDNVKASSQYPSVGAPAKRPAKRKLGAVPKSRRHGVPDNSLRPVLRGHATERRRAGGDR